MLGYVKHVVDKRINYKSFLGKCLDPGELVPTHRRTSFVCVVDYDNNTNLFAVANAEIVCINNLCFPFEVTSIKIDDDGVCFMILVVNR